MTTTSLRKAGLAACTAWLVVAGYAVWDLAVNTDSWELAYTIYAAALTAAVALTVGLLASITRPTDRPGLRVAGIAVGAVSTILAFIGAWALVLWMAVFAVAGGLLAAAASATSRRTAIVVAAAPLAAAAVQYGSLVLGADEDVASSMALVVIVGGVVTALVGLVRDLGHGELPALA